MKISERQKREIDSYFMQKHGQGLNRVHERELYKKKEKKKREKEREREREREKERERGRVREGER